MTMKKDPMRRMRGIFFAQIVDSLAKMIRGIVRNIVQLASVFLLKLEIRKKMTTPKDINFSDRSKESFNLCLKVMNQVMGPTNKPARPICNPTYSITLERLNADEGLSKK
jgi:hypothetical protein